MGKIIRVGAVSYLNTKPLVYGFTHGQIIKDMELVEDYPSKIAMMLVNDEIDVGLVPVAIIPKLKEHYIISDYCIGAESKVASVCLFSDVPLKDVQKVLLDYQSRTSVALAKILIQNYWQITPELEDATQDFRKNITGLTAGLVIGDRAFEQRKQSAYIYDLAEAWIDFTKLPFVFAAWISNKKLPDDFVQKFNEANRRGVENIQLVAAENKSPHYDLVKYYTENISYKLNENKMMGLEKFLGYLKKQ